MLRTHCDGHKCFPVCPCGQHLLRIQNLCPRHKNVSDFFQKHFVSATNVSCFVQHRNNHEQQCVRHNVSSFATTLISRRNYKLTVWRPKFLAHFRVHSSVQKNGNQNEIYDIIFNFI